MSRISRRAFTGALMVVLICSACGKLTLTSPTPVWTIPPTEIPVFPAATMPASATATGESSATALIPITGEDVVSVQCEFCVDAETHAVLTFPDSAYFDVSSDAPISCLTADVTGGRRILICHGAQSTIFNLDICSDSSNCLHFPVTLQPCPILQTGATPMATGTAFNLTPINTLEVPTKKPTKKPTSTVVPLGTPTPQPATTSTPPSYSVNILSVTGE